jgi:hypothetical protein
MRYIANSIAIGLAIMGFITANAFAAVPLSGAVFTTNSTCGGTDLNIYSDKGDVYVDGGPSHPGAAGLPDGAYYVKVTEPDGTVLGSSNATTPVSVTNGEFDQCYRLSTIVKSTSSTFTTNGYDTTSNAGGEYKLWVCDNPLFTVSGCKTDNFKVRLSETTPETATLRVRKFYDANANGTRDNGEAFITGWKVRIQDGIDYIRFTPANLVVEPDTYTVTEFAPLETNWFRTTTNPVVLALAANEDKTAEFGNVCVGPGGGHTLGYWSNKNGQATINDGGTSAPELASLTALNLRNANGSDFNPATYTAFRTWLLSATATNMAYMLSAQFAAMTLNVESGIVDGSSLVYAPGTASANSLGFATINALMTEANAQLLANPVTVASGAARTAQAAIKNALDAANNNQNFVQATACPFTFAE